MKPDEMSLIEKANGGFVELSGGQLDKLLRLKRQPIDAVPTPLPAWNHRCRDFGGGVGLARGWHVTIAAKTGNGKSVFALNMAYAAVEESENVAFVSLEMFWTQLTTRYMAIVSGERIDLLEPGSRLDEKAHKRAQRAVDELKERTRGALWCNTRHISDLDDILDAIRFLFEVKGCKTVIVDYMQLAKVVGSRDLLDAVTQISGDVRRIGADNQLVTIGLSQFNRQTSADHENSPTAQGLMGGSPLENDSDQVMLIDHTKYQRNTLANTATQPFLLDKNRHGPTTEINCVWDYSNLRIREVAPVFNGPIVPPPDRGEAWEPDEEAA